MKPELPVYKGYTENSYCKHKIMNESIAIPISGPSANENTRIKSFRYKPFFNIDGRNTMQTKHSVIIARICDFCLYFIVFLFIFITLLLFTVVNFQDKMEMDDQAADENMALLGPTSICQSGEVSVRPNCVSKNLSEFSKNKSDKNRPRQESVEQQAPGSDPSQRPFFEKKVTNAGRRHNLRQ